jgi:DNA topoisomerase-3
MAPVKPETKKEPKKHTSKPDASEGKEKTTDVLMNQPCPLCGKGVLLKGKTAYGCSEWKNGCTYRKAFE